MLIAIILLFLGLLLLLTILLKKSMKQRLPQLSNTDKINIKINDKFEQAWLSFYQESPSQIKWIGLSDSDIKGQYSWSNEDNVVFNNWDRNKPGK